MTLQEAIVARHSVRQYIEKPIEAEKVQQLQTLIDECNREGGLHIQLVTEEPNAFAGGMAKYGKFRGVRNYIAMICKKGDDVKLGYYGEKVILLAQTLGLNTCWVALTRGKSRAIVAEGEKEVILIALGYGKTQGSARKSKGAEDVSNLSPESPAWFKRGVEAALLAPTAVNQQKFRFTLSGNKVSAKAGAIGPCLKTDLGIVKCHFEIGAGRENFKWA